MDNELFFIPFHLFSLLPSVLPLLLLTCGRLSKMGEEKDKPKEKDKDPKKEEKKEEKDRKDKKKEDKEDVGDKEKKKKDEKGADKETPKEIKANEDKDEPTKESKPPKVNANSAPAHISADAPRQGRRRGDQRLKSGSVVKTEKHEFKIERTLGAGALGHVYKVYCDDNDVDIYAMKTEWENTDKKDKKISQLKMELCVLQDANSEVNHHKEFFTKLIDKGMTTTFRFFVMELVSHTLQDILTVMCRKEMPTQSAAFLMNATAKAIDALHQLGYIHRDIKPHNFAIGLPPFEKKVYILGFGIARSYWAYDDKRVRPPRKSVKFVGTLKYCSRQNHAEKEQSIKDDYESWAYMCLEFFHESNITWDKLNGREEIYAQKKNLFSTLDQTELKMPSSFKAILKDIDRMTYTDSITWSFNDRLKEVMFDTKTDDKTKLIWEKEAMPVSKTRKKGAKNRVQNDEDSDDRKQRENKAKRREILAKKKRVEDELMRVMREVESDERDSKDKKGEGHRPSPQRKRRTSDQRKRPSGGRKKKTTREYDSDEYDDHDDYEDSQSDSYEEEKPRRKASVNKRHDDPKRRKDLRKRTSRATTERTYEDHQRDRRRDKRSSNDRRKSSKMKSNRRRSRPRTIDQEEKILKLEDSPLSKDCRRGVRKKSSLEKNPSTDKMEEMDGEKRLSGQRTTKDGPTEGNKDVLAAKIDGSDKVKKK